MTKEHIFLEKTHTLLEPIELDEKTISVVVVKPWSALENVELLPKGEALTFKEQCAMMEAATGLSQDQINELVTQDYNSIWSDVHNFYIKTGYELADPRSDKEKLDDLDSEYEQDAENRTVTLYFSDRRIVNLKRPKIKITKAAEEFPTIIEQRMFILAQISDLSQDEVEALPLPDYRSLNEVVAYFLSSKAG